MVYPPTEDGNPI